MDSNRVKSQSIKVYKLKGVYKENVLNEPYKNKSQLKEIKKHYKGMVDNYQIVVI